MELQHLSLALLLFAAIQNVSSMGGSNYCRLSPAHTMCQYQGFGSCGSSGPINTGVSEAEKRQIVDLHNKFRSGVAQGQERKGRPGPQRPAGDMMELQWDQELANIAQKWADQCQFGHDSERGVERFRVGQNVYEAGDFNDGPVNWQQAIMGWYDEVELVNNRDADSFRFIPSTGHYTQMVWAQTRTVGCGSITYKSGRFFKKYMVCNYGPGGNLLRAPIYKVGQPCSSCPSGTSCSTRSPGLCSAARGPTSGPVAPIRPTPPVEIPSNTVDDGMMMDKPEMQFGFKPMMMPVHPVEQARPVRPVRPVRPAGTTRPISPARPVNPQFDINNSLSSNTQNQLQPVRFPQQQRPSFIFVSRPQRPFTSTQFRPTRPSSTSTMSTMTRPIRTMFSNFFNLFQGR